MNATFLDSGGCAYPAAVGDLLGRTPTIAAAGNLDLIRSRPLALFCSIRCPGDVILRTYDLVRTLRDAGVPVIGGFHPPMEKECLAFLLRGTQPVLVCPARSIGGMRLPAGWNEPLADGRLLVLSPFAEKHRRITADTSQTRNLFVAALAEQVFVAYAGPGSKTETLCRQVQAWGKPLWTLDSGENAALVSFGAKPLRPDEVRRIGLVGRKPAGVDQAPRGLIG